MDQGGRRPLVHQTPPNSFRALTSAFSAEARPRWRTAAAQARRASRSCLSSPSAVSRGGAVGATEHIGERARARVADDALAE